MKQLFLLLLAALFCYFGYVTVSIYMSLNNGVIDFRPEVAEDWMFWLIILGCFGFAFHALTGLVMRRRSG